VSGSSGKQLRQILNLTLTTDEKKTLT